MRSTKTARARIRVTGIVQGVGFRPFIYGLASRFGLTGHVLNDSHGVLIEVQGDPTTVESFAREIRPEAPPLSSVEDVELDWIDVVPDESVFSISESVSESTKRALVSPDVATCNDCLREILDRSDRRYLYPFTNCTNCGPRLTIVKDLPYDRPLTTMSDFKMCPDCQREYDDPSDRRFHAQPNACPVCGPAVSLVSTSGESLDADDPIAGTIDMLRRGMVVAVKGIGGFHLACDAANDDAVAKIRKHKGREFKPLAVMVNDIAQARRVCQLKPEEEGILLDISRPILIADRNPDSPLSRLVAPGQTTVGIMLPYTPLHHILLDGFGGALVMTSANLSDRPIIKEIEELGESLSAVIDAVLTHNRDIYVRCDDSVVRSFRGELYPVRRSRGFAPKPFDLGIEPPDANILALGADMKNTFCLLRGNRAFLSHHIGDVDTNETLDVLSWAVDHYENMFDIKPELVAVDLHPTYMTSTFGGSLGLGVKGIQHHHAHIASCMADNELEGEVIGVALDGTGYGTDGSIWGCEFLLADFSDFQRVGHLATVQLPSGEAAVREPWRMAVAWLVEALGPSWREDHVRIVERIGDSKTRVIEQLMQKDLNSPRTSSMGRLFDAVASLLEVRDVSTYEGQAASELEAYARGGQQDRGYEFALVESGGVLIAEPTPVIKRMVADIAQGVPGEDIALSFHYAVARMIFDICSEISRKHRNKRVVLSGGVFQNMTLLETVVMLLDETILECYHHRRVPTNDGGISLGQVCIAARGG